VPALVETAVPAVGKTCVELALLKQPGKAKSMTRTNRMIIDLLLICFLLQ
jgi:hypothetical protein